MLIFKNYRGQFHKMNTALAALTSLYVIGAAVALSSPYATTPLGIGVLTTVAITLIGLAWYTISKNNEISEEKAPKLVSRNGQVMLLVTRDMFEEMKKNKNKEGQLIDNEYYIRRQGPSCYY
ncbi:hypothetical protein [Wolbachia endosymbiont of Madathamugadia hiepei]|uniref:hypothetical protein n=1 Tax=Wolbachia endosymbiont of Madathamugadia hiepei TaxID=1241303 RepID=UPI001FE4D06B|nr:hypothetical protein [Wolbachia endosymbiont of Madathamugadia hiepei]